MSLLGIDIGGTTCAAVAGTASGDVLARREFSSRAELGPRSMIADLIQAAREVLGTTPCDRCGVSVGGPLDAPNGIVMSPPNLPGWDRVPLKEILSRELEMPVRVEHDAAACARAELLWGGGKGCSRLAYLTCGTGFGVGLLIDGAPYYGAGGRSIEIGHVRYLPDGPQAFGKAGSYESFASAPGLSRCAAWLSPARWSDSPPSPEAVAVLAQAGDPEAIAAIRMNAAAVGSACALIADLLAPERILLGSLARYLGASWVSMVVETFRSEALGGPVEGTRVEPAELGERLQDLSAIAAAMPTE